MEQNGRRNNSQNKVNVTFNNVGYVQNQNSSSRQISTKNLFQNPSSRQLITPNPSSRQLITPNPSSQQIITQPQNPSSRQRITQNIPSQNPSSRQLVTPPIQPQNSFPQTKHQNFPPKYQQQQNKPPGCYLQMPQYQTHQFSENPQTSMNNKLNNLALNLFGPLEKSYPNNTTGPFNGNISISVKFPNASRYFNKEKVENQIQMALLQELQNLLTTSRKFIDTANPKPNYGSYIKASQIFKNQQFFLFSQSQSVFERGRQGVGSYIQPKDVWQGGAGDCYLLVAVASLANTYPELISNSFLFLKNPADFYAVRLFCNGQWQYIVTDDQFPCMPSGAPAHCINHGNQIWMMLLEKCWAKLFGSYEAIGGGTPSQGLNAITGLPISKIFTSRFNFQQIKCMLAQAYRSNHIVTAGCANKQLNDIHQKERIGLSNGHAYSVLNLYMIEGEAVVKLRNTFQKIWKGDWSFYSNKWTDRARQQLNYFKDPKDGTFYMPIQQFSKYFSAITICHVTPSYKFSALKFNCQNQKSIALSISINTEGLYYFMLYHPDKRDKRRLPTDYEYAIIAFDFTSFKQSPQPISSDNHISFQMTLRPGVYKLGLALTWRTAPYPIVLNTYGPAQTKLVKN